MKLRIYKSEIDGELVKALFNESEEELLAWGDGYHDKITEIITGFLQGLKYAKINYELLDEKFIDEDDRMYYICLFDRI